MINLNNFLNENAPVEISKFVSNCVTGDELIKKVNEDPSWLPSILLNMKIEENKTLAARLLYRISSKDLENPELKRVETLLRNQDMLLHTSDFNLLIEEDDTAKISAHQSILAFESPYFQAMKNFREFRDGRIVIKAEGISFKAYQLVIQYLYLSDNKRKEFILNVDKSLLFEIAQISLYWNIDELRMQCDEEVCKLLIEANIENEDINDWLAQSHLLPKFAMLMEFVKRIAKDSDWETTINELGTLQGSISLVAKCTPKEVEAFSTLKTVFGEQCYLQHYLKHIAFGKSAWDNYLGNVVDEPPLPMDIYKILKSPCPFWSGKKVEDTHMLVLVPRKVDGKPLDFYNLKKLVENPINGFATQFLMDEEVNKKYGNDQVYRSHWVLMAKDVVNGSKSYHQQTIFINEVAKTSQIDYKISNLLDVTVCLLTNYVRYQDRLFPDDPLTYTRCEESLNGWQIMVGNFSTNGLYITYDQGSNFGIVPYIKFK